MGVRTADEKWRQKCNSVNIISQFYLLQMNYRGLPGHSDSPISKLYCTDIYPPTLYYFWSFTSSPVQTSWSKLLPCVPAGSANPEYLPAVPLDNLQWYDSSWQARLTLLLTDWQPIPAVILSCLTPLHWPICHPPSPALCPRPPTPPFLHSSTYLWPAKNWKAVPGSCALHWQSAALVTWDKAIDSGYYTHTRQPYHRLLRHEWTLFNFADKNQNV